MKLWAFGIILVWSALAVGCSDREAVTAPGDDVTTLPPDPDGMPLPGAPEGNALDAVVSLAPSPVSDAELDGSRMTTRIRAVLAPDATVGDVNRVLEENGAAIVSMGAGSPIVVLVVDPVATEEDAQALATTLASTEPFLAAFPGRTFGTSAAIDGTPGRAVGGPVGPAGRAATATTNAATKAAATKTAATTATTTAATTMAAHAAAPNLTAMSISLPGGWDPNAEVPFAHLELMTLLQTWKTRPLLSDDVPIVLADRFGDLPEHAEVPGLGSVDEFGGFHGSDPTPDGSRYRGNDGFHHAGLIGASWDGSSLVGIHPDGEIDAVVIGGLDMSEVMREITSRLEGRSGSQVLVTPLNFSYDPTVPVPMESAMLAAEWKFYLRSAGLEERVLHIASAGDTGLLSPLYSVSHTTSPWNLATSYSELIDYVDENNPTEADRAEFVEFETMLGIGLGLDSGPTDNVLIVGASGELGSNLPSSSTLPHLITLGFEIPGPCVEADPGGDASLCNGSEARYTGTGAAASLVGGLASYLWNLAPGRTQNEIRNAIEVGYARGGGIGVVDAYHAVLALDPSLADPAVREMMLDVTGDQSDYPNLDEPNGIFDEKDIEVFLNRIHALDGSSLRAGDFQFDLNGDDLVDSEERAPFDLDADGSTVAETVQIDVHGETLELDEGGVTDAEILCYYAHSSLYLGSTEERDRLLECVQPTGLFVELSPLPDRVSADESVEVTVTAGFRAEDGSIELREGVEISFESDGASVQPRSGVTDAAGAFRATVTFGSDENEMTVGVWAESDDEEVYREETVKRRNEIEFVERYLYLDASVFSVYNQDVGIPAVDIVRRYTFLEEDGAARVDTVLTEEGEGSRVGMTVRGNVRTQVTTSVELGGQGGLDGVSISSTSQGSITLESPNFDILSYQAQADGNVDLSVEFQVWGDPATFSLSGVVGSTDSEVYLDGPEGDIFECDESSGGCGSINESGALAPGYYTFAVYHSNGGFIRWFENCDGCTVSGTESSQGLLDVELGLSH